MCVCFTISKFRWFDDLDFNQATSMSFEEFPMVFPWSSASDVPCPCETIHWKMFEDLLMPLQAPLLHCNHLCQVPGAFFSCVDFIPILYQQVFTWMSLGVMQMDCIREDAMWDVFEMFWDVLKCLDGPRHFNEDLVTIPLEIKKRSDSLTLRNQYRYRTLPALPIHFSVV